MANDMQQVILMTMPMPMHPDRQKFISYDQRPFTVGDRQPHVSIKPLQKRHSEGRSQLGVSDLKLSKTTCQSIYVLKPNR